MENKEMSKVPLVRFQEFTEDWEQRKFMDQYEKVIEKNDLTYGTDKIISVANMYYKQDTKESSDDYMRTYNVMRLGDIAFEGNKSKNFAHGRFVENTIGDGIVSHVFDVFRPVVEYDLYFWKYLINNESIMGKIMTRCTKASTMMTNLVADDFLKESISIPSIEEQRKIGKYLQSLDHLITLYQCKCDVLERLKKSMLEKMFPQNGADVPEIRFAGFTDAWEQRKLGDVLSLLKDGTHGTHRDSEDGPYLLSAKNIRNGQIVIDDSIDRKISVEEFEQIHSTFSLQSGDVLLTIVGSVGESAVLENPKGVTFQRSVAFLRPKEEMLSDFLHTEIESDKFQKELQDRKSQSAQPGVYLGELEKIPIVLPSKKEQEQIGAIFAQLDHRITLHQRKLDTLKNLKKSMLTKMFV